MLKRLTFLFCVLVVTSVTMAQQITIVPDSIKNRVIRVGGDNAFRPFEYINAKGYPDGFNVELFKKIMARLGIPYTIELGEWNKVLYDFEKGDYDLLMGLIYTNERSQKFSFGLPHSIIYNSIVSRKDNRYYKLEELKGKKIVVQQGDKNHDLLKNVSLTDSLYAVETIAEALLGMTEGKFDAFLGFDITAIYYLKQLKVKNLAVAKIDGVIDEYCIAVKKNDDELLYLINSTLQQMKIDGEYDQLYYKWFGIYEKTKMPIWVWFVIGAIGFIAFLCIGFLLLLRLRIRIATQRLNDSNSKMATLIKELKVAKHKAEESERLKMAFLANMSHEIRTPLNSIVGFSELLQETDNPDERSEYMQIINTNNELLLHLIGEILDLSKIESGSVDLHFEKFDVVELFFSIYSTFKPRCLKKNLDLIADCNITQCEVELDKGRLTQVFNNFLTNAIKYTEKGKIVMSINKEENGFCLSIRDTGIGIAEENRDMVFQHFKKLDNFAQGTGLGLAICRAITTLLHGKIGYESVLGEGSVFWAWFPCYPPDDSLNVPLNDTVEEA